MPPAADRSASHVVGQAKHIRRKFSQLTNDFRRMGGGQQTDFFRHQACRKGNREPIPVAAGVEYVLAVGQGSRDAQNVREEDLSLYRYSRAVSNNRVRGVVRYQRKSGQDATSSCGPRCSPPNIAASGRSARSLRCRRAAECHIAWRRRGRSRECLWNPGRDLRHRAALRVDVAGSHFQVQRGDNQAGNFTLQSCVVSRRRRLS